MKTRLEQLAGKNANRLTVLAARLGREKMRSRRIICTACGENEYDTRDATDVCGHCLENIWMAQNIIAGEYRAGKRGGLIPVWLTTVSHWIGYPGLETSSYDQVPAPFGRGSSNDTLNTLYVELFAALAEALPLDPKGADEAEPLLSMKANRWSSGDKDTILARIPTKAADALRDLWAFVRWHSKAAYQHGFDDGHNLLARLNLGNLTAEGFAEEIAEQTERMREQMTKIAKRARIAAHEH